MNMVAIDETELQRLKDAEQLLKKVHDLIVFTNTGMPRLESSALLACIIMFYEQ